MGSDNQRLILVIADDADSASAFKLGEFRIKFGAELGIGDVMNGADNASVRICDSHSSTLCAQM